MQGAKVLIIGSGITGIVLAERFANAGAKVLVIEKRNHIGGNCYDFEDGNGIFVHQYGPHIVHTHYKEVWDYLSRFTDWIYYQHKVLGFIDGQFVPIPFNLNTLYMLFSRKMAERIERKLLRRFGFGEHKHPGTSKNRRPGLTIFSRFRLRKGIFALYLETVGFEA